MTGLRARVPGKVANVLFDLDGTLTDSRHGIVACLEHAMSALGEPLPAGADLASFIGSPLREVFRVLLSTTADDARIECAVTAYRARFTDVGMFENRVYDGIPEVLEQLSKRARLFVATSKPQAQAVRILEHFGLARRFEHIYGSELDGRLAVKGELIAHVMGSARLAASETVMVGDRYHDIVGAVQSGLFPAGVTWGYGSRDELTESGALALLDAPGELLALVGSNGALVR